MKSKPGYAYHSYQAKSLSNRGKTLKLRQLLSVWRKGLTYAMHCWTDPLVRGEELPR